MFGFLEQFQVHKWVRSSYKTRKSEENVDLSRIHLAVINQQGLIMANARYMNKYLIPPPLPSFLQEGKVVKKNQHATLLEIALFFFYPVGDSDPVESAP